MSVAEFYKGGFLESRDGYWKEYVHERKEGLTRALARVRDAALQGVGLGYF
jgi:hypothetical protein